MRVPDIWSGPQNWRLLDIRAINAPPGTVGLIQMARESNQIIVSVKEGALDVWLGDFTVNTSDPPHLHFGQTNRPVSIDIPGGVRDITYRTAGADNPNLATILVGGT